MTEKVHNVDIPLKIDKEERNRRYAAQGGLRLICKDREATDADHNHATGEVRGLLCNRCNTLLGKVRERPAALRRLAADRPRFAKLYNAAADYLEKFGNNPGDHHSWSHNAASAKEAGAQWLDYYRRHLAKDRG